MYHINKLLKQNQILFHTQDLALLWNISNRNSLYTVIKRLINKGVLIPLQKGLYSTKPLDLIDPRKLGISLIHTYSYLSTESVLFDSGIISQKIFPITYVSSVSKRINILEKQFLYRKLNDRFLIAPYGVDLKNGIYIAEPERAIADMLYFNPKYYFDNSKLINWGVVHQIQKQVGYK